MAGTLLGLRIGVGSDENWNPEKLRIDTSHSATYLVRMDSESSRETAVALVTGVPTIGSDSPILTGAKCIKRTIKEIGPALWEVEAEFSQQYDTEPSESDPWDLDPEWSWGFELHEEPLLYDAQNDTLSITNSAGEPLPSLTYQVAVPVLTIKRAEATFAGETIIQYVNSVNSATFWGADPGTALLAGIQADPAKHEGTKYWEVTYTIKFRLHDNYGWKAVLLDQGTFYWSGTVGSSQKIPFGDDAFQQVLGNLNGSGGQNLTSTPAFVQFNRYPEKDFDDLSLGPF